MEPFAIEDLFERNADMRLLELRHSEAGGTTPAAIRRSTSSFGAESIVTTHEEIELDHAPRLRIAIAAAPASGVIPGAVVGVSVDIFNDGTAPAPECKLLLALPHECEFRNGTLRIDGREPVAGEHLFGAGLPIARLPGDSTTKVTFQLVVLAGVGALYLQPRLQADGVPVVGTPGISVKRANGSGTQTAPARPFYELEDDEPDEVANPADQEAILPPVIPPPAAPPPVAPPPPRWTPPTSVAAEPAPSPTTPPARTPKSSLAASAPPKTSMAETPWPKAPPQPKTASDLAAVAFEARPVDDVMPRYRTISAADIALLERLFAAPAPGVIAHYVLISSIACCEAPDGSDSSGYVSFLQRDIAALARALVLARMGKPPGYRIEQEDLESLELPWQPQPVPAAGTNCRLRRDLRRTEHAAIGGLLQPSERDVTLRLRIALLALAGASIEGADRSVAEAGMAALAQYRSAVLAWLVPACIASAKDGPALGAPPENVELAGRRVVAALKDALAA